MDIFYKNNKLSKQCCIQKEGEKAFGKNQAAKLQQRLSELLAAENLAEISKLPPTRCHELIGNLKEVFSVDLLQPYRLLFKPNHKPIPTLKNGGIDLTQVTSIIIIEVKDTH